jgi:hypothetical protein
MARATRESSFLFAARYRNEARRSFADDAQHQGCLRRRVTDRREIGDVRQVLRSGVSDEIANLQSSERSGARGA